MLSRIDSSCPIYEWWTGSESEACQAYQARSQDNLDLRCSLVCTVIYRSLIRITIWTCVSPTWPQCLNVYSQLLTGDVYNTQALQRSLCSCSQSLYMAVHTAHNSADVRFVGCKRIQCMPHVLIQHQQLLTVLELQSTLLFLSAATRLNL